jgi:hypothetical protein
MRYSLLVFKDQEVIGEYVYYTEPKASIEVLTTLKPELSVVVLDESGIVYHSENLPQSNPWYRAALVEKGKNNV